jgi:hypothetical protein
MNCYFKSIFYRSSSHKDNNNNNDNSNNVYIIQGGKWEGISLTFSVEKKQIKKSLIQARTCEISFPFSPLINIIYTHQRQHF